MSLIAHAIQLEQRNELINLRAQQLTKFFKDGGFRTCVLKGQGIALLYPNPKRMLCGDIDLWVEGKRDDVVNYMRSKGVKVYDVHLVHATAEFFKDVPVEIHFRPSWMYNPFLDGKLQAFFASQASEQFSIMTRPLVSLILLYSSILYTQWCTSTDISLKRVWG